MFPKAVLTFLAIGALSVNAVIIPVARSPAPEPEHWSQVDRRQIVKGRIPGEDIPHPVLEPRPQTTIPGIKEVADGKYKPKGRLERPV